MDTQLFYLSLLALPLVGWSGWESFRWLRAATDGSWECAGREVPPRQAALIGAAKGLVAIGIAACVVAYGAGAPDAVVVVGPLLMILFSYVVEREVRRRFRPLTAEESGDTE